MRLVDLHLDWLRQYAAETTEQDPALYPEVADRVGRLDGYLLGCTLSVLAIGRKPVDWTSQPDPWAALGRMIARCEAEFAGRLLRDPADIETWRAWPEDGMCWGVLGVGGLDFLVRSVVDLDRLPDLFERGVRVFQPIAAAEGDLGGSIASGDDRALTELGRALLDRLATLASHSTGPRPAIDLAGMNARTISDVLSWHDASGALLPIALTHGTIDYRAFLDGSNAGARLVEDLRARGVVIGLTPGLPGSESPDELKEVINAIAEIPFEGRPGPEGIAIGSDLMGLERPASGLGSAREMARWIGKSFDRAKGAAMTSGNAERLILQMAGV